MRTSKYKLGDRLRPARGTLIGRGISDLLPERRTEAETTETEEPSLEEDEEANGARFR